MFCEFKKYKKSKLLYICTHCNTIIDSRKINDKILCRSKLKNMSEKPDSGVRFERQTTTIQSTTTNKKIDVHLPNKNSESNKVCSQQQIDKRLSICNDCEYYDNNTCLQCGCALSREKVYMNKLYLAHQSCPIGKWGPENTTN